ncbi:hypothetical protein AALP_AAs63571U000500 [Arabis alpina]|uniref:TF-B3 domain-containing protein n=1 Tax=Arabis alpina TaxID=50452 RepID=A0A087FWA5_ARAAL|nr:hypothetical protein AALP_AAs63571U000500 [Arabis alpina]
MFYAGYLSNEENGGDDKDNTELARKKKARMTNLQTKVGPSSSGISCFVAFVTASNLNSDSLYLPIDFTSSDAIKRKYGKIVLTDGRETSWEMDLNIFYENEKSRVRGQNRFVKLTLTEDCLKSSRLYIPLTFMREHGLNKPGMITLLGKNGMKTAANVREESMGRVSLGRGWNDFAKANALKIDDTFMMELFWDNGTPVLSLLSSESKSHTGFVTLTLTDDNVRKSRVHLPMPFVRANGLVKPGMMTLISKDGTRSLAKLLRVSSTGRMSLGRGFKEFVIGNGLIIGESFTFELVWENETPMLSLCN